MQAAPRSMWRRALSAYHMVLQSHAACQCLPSAHLYMSTSRIQNSVSCCRTGAEAHQQAAMLALGYCHPDNLPPLFEEMPALIEDYSSVKTNVGACTGMLHQWPSCSPRTKEATGKPHMLCSCLAELCKPSCVRQQPSAACEDACPQ